MHPLQVIALAALVLGVGIYVWRRVKREIWAEDQFFASLVSRLSELLGPQGLRLKRQVHLPNSFGYRMATFEGAGFLLDLVLDGKERDIRLVRRAQDDAEESAGHELAGRYLGDAPTASDYAQAAAAILDAARATIGAA